MALPSPEEPGDDADETDQLSPSSPSRVNGAEPAVGGWGSLDDDDVSIKSVFICVFEIASVFQSKFVQVEDTSDDAAPAITDALAAFVGKEKHR